MSQQRNQKNQLIRLNADKDLTAAAAEGRVPEQHIPLDLHERELA